MSFVAAVALSIALGTFDWGQRVIYPFALLATWAHEMGHGIGAMLTGNRFLELELYSNLGGQALVAGADGWSQVVVSSLGLVGPAVLGGVIMVAGARPRLAPHVLSGLAIAVVVSTIVWVRNGFGFLAMVLIGAALVAAARLLPTTGKVVLNQLVAIQLALAAWSSRDYLFVAGFERDGYHRSDTQRIADEWLLPYWFWGALLGGASVAVLASAFWVAWIRPRSAGDEQPAVL